MCFRDIEFVGLPGVGKSWLCSEIADLDHRKVLDLHFGADETGVFKRNTVKYVRSCRFMFRKPRAAMAIFKTANQLSKLSFAIKVRKIVYLYSELYLSESYTKGRNLVREQGVLQAVWSLFSFCSVDSRPQELLRVLGDWLPDTIIVVCAPDTRSHLDRLTQRNTGHSRFESPDSVSFSELTTRGENTLRSIVETCLAINEETTVFWYLNSNGCETSGSNGSAHAPEMITEVSSLYSVLKRESVLR